MSDLNHTNRGRAAKWQIVPKFSPHQLPAFWNGVWVPEDVDRDTLIALVAEDAKVPVESEMRLLVSGDFINLRSITCLPSGELSLNIIIQPSGEPASGDIILEACTAHDCVLFAAVPLAASPSSANCAQKPLWNLLGMLIQIRVEMVFKHLLVFP